MLSIIDLKKYQTTSNYSILNQKSLYYIIIIDYIIIIQTSG